MYFLVFLFINLAFLVLLLRLSKWYDIRKEGYWYHLACLNLAAFLIVINEQVNLLLDYPFIIKLFIALAIAYIALGLFKNRITDFFNDVFKDSKK